MKGLILDYGATIDSNGKHWAEVLWDAYCSASLPLTKEQFREAYIYGERYLSMVNVITPEQNFFELMQVRIGIQMDYLIQHEVLSEQILNTTLKITSEGEVPILAKGELTQHFVDYMAGYCYDYARRCTLDACPVVEYLADKYELAMVSNFYGNLSAVLQDFGLLRCFKVVVDSTEVGIRKPDPAIFQTALDRLQLPAKEVAVLGDSFEKDIQPALSIGCQGIWFKGVGWNPSSDKDIRFEPSINSLLQVYDIL
ncbi:MAG: HAD family hydrolase [Bacteroidales bacterium]|jgi:putative hydrolase of the HAD superfamily|nr:HAD family hydrolase [Bacteroidales bacterium]MBO7378426.1 HAD family hydrolase [Bacteroidales bacterium]MBP5213486.1 HAD family hydrolase [Bacteroidales bacterium]